MSTSALLRRGLLLAALVLPILLLAACDDEDPDFQPAQPGVLAVATEGQAPGFWNNDALDGSGGGLELAIARELASRFGLQLKIVRMPFERIVAGDLGGADIALSQVTITPGRGEKLRFTAPYLEATSGVLAPAGRPMATLADARAARWVIESGTTQQDFLVNVIKPAAAPLVVPNYAEILKALATGAADAALLDLPTALAEAKASGGTLDVPAQFATSERMAAALPKASKNFDAVDAAIRDIKDNGMLAEFERSELRPVLAREPASVPVIATP